LTAITRLNTGTWQVSLPFQGEEEIVGSYIIAGKDQLAIIDPGPGSTAQALLTLLQEAGFDPRDVTHLLATHIHLDHAGGVGTLLHAMPRATVYVHSKGAPHLVDTTKFVASVTRIYGARTNELWGKVESVPQERMQVIEGGDVLEIAGRRLEVHYTPGHAIHHVIFFDVHSGELFAGDVAGVKLQGIDYVRPPTPPPDLDLEAWSASIDKLKQLRPDLLYLGHFGPTQNVTKQLEQLRERLFSWGEFVLSALRDGKGEEEIIRLLSAQTQPELLRVAQDERVLQRYDLSTNYPMTVQGYIRYWKLKSQNR